MPSYTSLHGMGASAAEQLEEACKHGSFLSQQEVRERGKVSQTIIDLMKKLGILGDLPETNQFSLFDIGME
jgi:DNA polymerase-3 subunit alpha (Gram-positive type)